ncbi:MarR family winged helix-turn-helix transcriptional regulator [Cohnella nanjingensis]|uniref:MarR family transcriptional regulator n=1 Tax=Cohnella nanjingensis TaxID=1387779 RepID=A0A7X0RPN2_9BACL|nr:MarR family transcriptional regulator [Cohnella nanjingensis]MBB6671369.1 MarR family transcriptional regulator [Cohnella nanjingensis]
MGLTYRKLTNVFQHRLKAYEITPEQWSTLYQISLSDGLIQKEIADRTGKDRPATTRILDHLAEKQLVFKKADPQDRRSFLVFITEKGKRLVAETLPIEASFIAEVASCMTAEEYDQLLSLIRRIDERLDRLEK